MRLPLVESENGVATGGTASGGSASGSYRRQPDSTQCLDCPYRLAGTCPGPGASSRRWAMALLAGLAVGAMAWALLTVMTR